MRFDHKITNFQQFSAYYYFDDDRRTDPFSNFQAAGASIPGFGAIFKTRSQQWNLSHTWTAWLDGGQRGSLQLLLHESQGTLDHPVSTFNSVQDSCVVIPATNCFTDPTGFLLLAGIITNLPGRVGLPFITVSGGFVDWEYL